MSDIAGSFLNAMNLITSLDAETYGIIGLTLIVTLSSTGIAALIGVPSGIILGSIAFPGKKLLMRLIHTLMGLPPVIAGLLVYLLLSRQGPFGELRLLFTPTAMVIAQVMIIIPVVTGLTIGTVKLKTRAVEETCKGLGMSKAKTLYMLFHECRYPLMSVILAGYGRAVSEVGAVMLVGGNIQHNTRVMTTAIVLETGKGNYDRALALGIILLLISFMINWILQYFQENI